MFFFIFLFGDFFIRKGQLTCQTEAHRSTTALVMFHIYLHYWSYSTSCITFIEQCTGLEVLYMLCSSCTRVDVYL